MELEWTLDFKENAIYRLDENLRMIRIALAKVSESELWQKPNSSSNSLGVLVLHCCGNMTQYVCATLGNREDTRDRDAEFSAVNSCDKLELLELLTTTVAAVSVAINAATAEQLLEKFRVQGFEFSGLGCVLHAVEHFSYHTGQIAFNVKLKNNTQLGFYDGLDLNLHNGN